MELLMWWNLPFVLPFVAAAGYLLLMATGTAPAGHGEVEADADVDTDVGIEHDLDHGVEHTVGHGDAGSEQSIAIKALSFLGFGRVPLSIILMSFCFIWGFSGWAANRVFSGILFFPFLYFWPSALVALASSVLATRYLAWGLARVMPATETYAVSDNELVGTVAEARYAISERAGTAMLYDQYGNFREVECRVQPGQEGIPAGARVVLMRFDSDGAVFFVRSDPARSLRLQRP